MLSNTPPHNWNIISYISTENQCQDTSGTRTQEKIMAIGTSKLQFSWVSKIKKFYVFIDQPLYGGETWPLDLGRQLIWKVLKCVSGEENAEYKMAKKIGEQKY